VSAQIAILFDAAHLLPLASDCPWASVLNAFVLGFLEGGFFDQDALAFIVAPSPAELDDHRGKRAVLLGASCERSITTGQIDEVIEIGAREAQRPFFFHEEKIALPQCLTALDTLRVAKNGKDDKVLRRRLVEFGFALRSLHAFNMTRVGIFAQDQAVTLNSLVVEACATIRELFPPTYLKLGLLSEVPQLAK